MHTHHLFPKEVFLMSANANFYLNDPALSPDFNSLPVAVREIILDSGAEITTLGELQQIAEHYRGDLTLE